MAALKADVENEIKRRESNEKFKAKKQIIELAKAYGRSAEEVLDKVGAVLRKLVAAKYCHPENPELTLTGRGRKLSWVQALLDEGYIMADFFIPE